MKQRKSEKQAAFDEARVPKQVGTKEFQEHEEKLELEASRLKDENKFSPNPDIEVICLNSKNENSILGLYKDTGNLVIRNNEDIPRGTSVDLYFLQLDEVIKPGDYFLSFKEDGSFNTLKSSSTLLPSPSIKRVFATTNTNLNEKGINGISKKFVLSLNQRPSLNFFIGIPEAQINSDKNEPILSLGNSFNKTNLPPEAVLAPDPSSSLKDLGFTNHSGGAVGSDSAWDSIGRTYGVDDHRHYYSGRKTENGNIEITKNELEEGWLHVLEANKTLDRKPDNYKNLLSRNWFQVKNSEAILAIGSIDPKTHKVNGGTGWAVQMAIDSKKPIFVFNQEDPGQWYSFDYSKNRFSPCSIPTLPSNFAGIGTREINENGLKAIHQVYQKTINNLSLELSASKPNNSTMKTENAALSKPLQSDFKNDFDYIESLEKYADLLEAKLQNVSFVDQARPLSEHYQTDTDFGTLLATENYVKDLNSYILALEQSKPKYLDTKTSIDIYPSGQFEILAIDRTNPANASSLISDLKYELTKINPDIDCVVDKAKEGQTLIILNNIKEYNKPLYEQFINAFDKLSIKYDDTPFYDLKKSISNNPENNLTKPFIDLNHFDSFPESKRKEVLSNLPKPSFISADFKICAIEEKLDKHIVLLKNNKEAFFVGSLAECKESLFEYQMGRDKFLSEEENSRGQLIGEPNVTIINSENHFNLNLNTKNYSAYYEIGNLKFQKETLLKNYASYGKNVSHLLNKIDKSLSFLSDATSAIDAKKTNALDIINPFSYPSAADLKIIEKHIQSHNRLNPSLKADFLNLIPNSLSTESEKIQSSSSNPKIEEPMKPENSTQTPSLHDEILKLENLSDEFRSNRNAPVPPGYPDAKYIFFSCDLLPELTNAIEKRRVTDFSNLTDGIKLTASHVDVLANYIHSHAKLNTEIKNHFTYILEENVFTIKDQSISNNNSQSLSNPSTNQKQPAMENQKFGTAKLHTFEDGKTAYNITLFDKEVQKILPAEGKMKLFIMDNPNDPDKFIIVNNREKGDYAKTKLVLDLDPKHFDPKTPDFSLKVNNGYIDLVAAKSPNKDFYGVYQHTKGQANKSVGFASEPSFGANRSVAMDDKGVNLGIVFKDTAKTGGFEFFSALVNPSKIEANKVSFINFHQPEDATKNMVAFGSNKPNPEANIVIKLSEKGKDFIKNYPNSNDIKIHVSDRKAESISADLQFSDKNVYFLDKDSKQTTYLGSGWSSEKLNSLPADIVNNIQKETVSAKAAAADGVQKGDYVAFDVKDNYYMNEAASRGVISSPKVVGVVTDVKDKSLVVDSAIGSVAVEKSNPTLAGSTKEMESLFKDFYSSFKSQLDQTVSIPKPEQAKPKEKSKTPTASKTNSKAAAKTTDVKEAKGAAKSAAKPKSKGQDQGMSM